MAGILLILIALLAVAWAWKSGRLGRLTIDDGVALIAFLLGLRLLTTGRPLIGIAAMAGAAGWTWWRRKHAARTNLTPGDARRLLGVGENASLQEIREAHRRLIGRVHPDAGGSDELATRVNQARDTLIAELNRRQKRL